MTTRPPGDTICVVGIRGFGRHGVLPHETELGQEFTVDVAIDADHSAAAATDDLTATVDYGHVAALVHARIEGPPFLLIETLADRIAADLVTLPGVLAVAVTVHKPHAPMPVPVADVTVTRRRRAPVRAVLGLGSNLGDRAAHLQAALAGLATAPGIQPEAVSPVYETEPVGGPDQGAFLNAVVAVRTTLSPHALLRACQGLEAAAMRTREERWGPRTLDVDILDYAGLDLAEPDLVLPHPRAAARAFVLVPWHDLAPHDRPGGGPEVGALLDQLGPVAGVRLASDVRLRLSE